MESTSNREDKLFKDLLNDMIPSDALTTAIDWIGDYLSPQQVFQELQLKEWAENNGYTKQA